MNPQVNISDTKSQSARLLVPYQGYDGTYQVVDYASADPGLARARRSRMRRFFHITTVTLFVVILIHVFAHAFRPFTWFGDMGSAAPEHPASCVNDASWTVKEIDGPLHHYRFSAETSFDLPLSSDLFYFLAKGSGASGTFELTDSGEVGSDIVKVEITALYHVPKELEHTLVCQLSQGVGQTGVGIYTPPHWDHPHRTPGHIFFSVKVALPLPADGSLLQIDRFRTQLPLYAHTVGDLVDSVEFASILLESSNAPVVAESLFATHAGIHTSNAPITGRFNVSDFVKLQTSNGAIMTESLWAPRAELHTSSGTIEGSFNVSDHLTLQTSNAPVRVYVGLDNAGDKPTGLEIHTSNSPIGATLDMRSTTSDGTRGVFSVTAQTSNSALHVGVASAPVDSVLRLGARTSNGAARVQLHPTYEGTFGLYTSSYFRPLFEAHDDEDPAGRGRHRSVDVRTNTRGVMEGKLEWVPAESGRPLGAVTVRSSNKNVQLVVGTSS